MYNGPTRLSSTVTMPSVFRKGKPYLYLKHNNRCHQFSVWIYMYICIRQFLSNNTELKPSENYPVQCRITSARITLPSRKMTVPSSHALSICIILGKTRQHVRSSHLPAVGSKHLTKPLMSPPPSTLNLK